MYLVEIKNPERREASQPLKHLLHIHTDANTKYILKNRHCTVETEKSSENKMLFFAKKRVKGEGESSLTWQAANVCSGGRHQLGESDWVKECVY